ncbi:MAG TPA: DUF1501 domain-containing protein [Steroidobacteraceae bacterium]|jgi:uncharacterized protein (DUF1501 family)|nr:DUF1501 domain-containing protein [Steroidobacteraceae bacterium]
MNMAPQQAPLTRRAFLRRVGAITAGAALPGVLFAHTGGSARLVVVILRGALDGLAAVPPLADPAYAPLRRELAIAAPGSADGALQLDGAFGLHPSLTFLQQQYVAGELIVFHAVASPYRDRSHFDGQNVLENGLTRPIGSADGWLNRALAYLPARGRGGERAVAISQNVPLILRGDRPVISKSPQILPDVDEELLARLADLYSKDEWLAARLREAVETERLTGDAPAHSSAPMMTAAHSPPMTSGRAPAAPAGPGSKPRAPDRVTAVARMAGTLMRSEGGPELAVIEATGWDTHANQGAANGALAQRLAGLDGGLRALADELGDLWPQTAVLVVTEFGRTAAMNGTRGTDHGTGTCAFLLGGAVHGGRVIADWPGLARSALLDNRDLKPTLDLRSVFKTVLDEHLHVDAKTLAARIFPDSQGARALRGLMRV